MEEPHTAFEAGEFPRSAWLQLLLFDDRGVVLYYVHGLPRSLCAGTSAVGSVGFKLLSHVNCTPQHYKRSEIMYAFTNILKNSHTTHTTEFIQFTDKMKNIWVKDT